MADRCFAGLLVMLLMLGACGDATPTMDASGPLDVDDARVAAAERHFAPITAEGEAFDELLATGDFSRERIRDFIEGIYSPTVVFQDPSFNDEAEGHDELAAMYTLFLSYFGDAELGDRPVLVGDTTALSVIPFYGLRLGGHDFTEDQPLVEVDLIEVDGDRIGSLLLFYDLASLRRIKGDPPALDGTFQERYAEAWTVGSDAELAAIYAEGAVRHDGLAGVEAAGIDAILAAAQAWSAALPGATWHVRLPFGESSGRQQGAVFEIEHDGCAVALGIVAELDERGLVTDERLHYDAASLRTCGWVG